MNFDTPEPESMENAGKVNVVGGDETSLRAFLAYQLSQFSTVTGGTTVYIEQLPPGEQNIPVPIPEGFRVVGSIVHENRRKEILLATSLMPQEAVKTCEQSLLKANWKFVEEMPHGSGFVDQQRWMVHRTYCQEVANAQLTMMARKARDTTAIQLATQRQPQPCVPLMNRHMMRAGVKIYRFIPTLHTPGNARLTFQSSGGGGGSNGEQNWSSSAGLATTMSIDEIAASYHDQLITQGWKKNSENISSQSAVSSWQFQQDGNLFVGYFFLAASPRKKGEYMMCLFLHDHPL